MNQLAKLITVTLAAIFFFATSTASAATNPQNTCIGKTVGASCAPANTPTSRCYPLPSHPNSALSAGCYDTPATCQPKDSAYFSAPGGLTQRYFDSVAVNGPITDGNQLSCTASKPCLDSDNDLRPVCQDSIIPIKTDPGFSFGNIKADCDDKDIWSHYYGSANIENVDVTFDPGFVSAAKSNKKYTPQTPYSLLDTIQIKITFKKKCGLPAPTPAAVPMNIFLVLQDGRELPLAGANPVSFTKVSDYVYTKTIDLQTYLTEDMIAAIAKAATKGQGGKESAIFKLKLLGHPYGDMPRTLIGKDTPKYANLPLTNCVQVFGEGKHKVVYMRDKIGGNGQILDWSKSGITGFTSIEPLKTYQNQFSHFVDLKKHDYSFSSIYSKTIRKLRETSSCGFWNSMYFGMYLDTTSSYGIGNGWVAYQESLDTAIIQVGGYDKWLPHMLVHEFGHAFANLADEYYNPDLNNSFQDENDIRKNLIPHCSLEPARDYSSGGKIYGATNIESCTIASRDPGYPNRPKIFRPSLDSIMHSSYVPLPGYAQGSNTENYTRFNVVSCGHILKRIKDTPSAKQYFPECAAMPGIIPVGQ